eukprot:GFYU01002253.1.p1 GENE.GFYU01002253.1~~GFYU01002253.1.p1  ORF type:complete len:990 (-),score=223.13 GFYU01002253.1:306-3275(-)
MPFAKMRFVGTLGTLAVLAALCLLGTVYGASPATFTASPDQENFFVLDIPDVPEQQQRQQRDRVSLPEDQPCIQDVFDAVTSDDHIASVLSNHRRRTQVATPTVAQLSAPADGLKGVSYQCAFAAAVNKFGDSLSISDTEFAVGSPGLVMIVPPPFVNLKPNQRPRIRFQFTDASSHVVAAGDQEVLAAYIGPGLNSTLQLFQRNTTAFALNVTQLTTDTVHYNQVELKNYENTTLTALTISPKYIVVAGLRSQADERFVEIFARDSVDDSKITLIKVFVANATQSDFGRSVAVDGDTFAIGDPGKTQMGQVHIYRYDPASGSWTYQPSVHSGTNDPDDYGFAVAMKHGLLGVGAPLGGKGLVEYHKIVTTGNTVAEHLCSWSFAESTTLGHAVAFGEMVDGNVLVGVGVPSLNQVLMMQINANAGTCFARHWIHPPQTLGSYQVGASVVIGDGYVFMNAPEYPATIQGRIFYGLISFAEYCPPNKHLSDTEFVCSQSLIQECTACGPGTFSDGGRATECTTCTGTKPFHSAWNANCTWQCLESFFGDNCLPCSEHNKNVPIVSPDSELRAWQNGKAECRAGCKSGYEEVSVNTTGVCCVNKPVNSIWASTTTNPCGYTCRPNYFGDKCEPCSVFAEQTSTMIKPPNSIWRDNKETCDWQCNSDAGYILDNNQLSCRLVDCGSPRSCDDCLAYDSCAWCPERNACTSSSDMTCNQTYRRTCPSELHEFVNTIGAAVAAVIGTLLLCIIFCFVVKRNRFERPLDFAPAHGMSRAEHRAQQLQATRSVLEMLPVEVFTADTVLKHDDPSCCICLAEYEEGEEIRGLPCHHVFHRNCIDGWLTSNREPVCPLCKVNVPESVMGNNGAPIDNGVSSRAPGDEQAIPLGQAPAVDGYVPAPPLPDPVRDATSSTSSASSSDNEMSPIHEAAPPNLVMGAQAPQSFDGPSPPMRRMSSVSAQSEPDEFDIAQLTQEAEIDHIAAADPDSDPLFRD